VMWGTCVNPLTALSGADTRSPVDRRHKETDDPGLLDVADVLAGGRSYSEVVEASRPCTTGGYENEQRVRGDRLGDGVLHDATVLKRNINGTYSLRFDDGSYEACVLPDRIQAAGWGWDSIRAKVELASFLRKPELGNSEDSGFSKLLPETTAHLRQWLEKRQESVESALESAFNGTLTEHSASSTESDTDQTQDFTPQRGANEGLNAFLRAHQKMTDWVEVVKKSSIESMPHCVAAPGATVCASDDSETLVRAKLKQAEGFPTVRAFSQPSSSSSRVGELPSGGIVLGKRPRKGDAFMWICWQGMEGYVGWKNVMTDSVTTLSWEDSLIQSEAISKRHILKLGLPRAQGLEKMLRELFQLHDLNGDGVLEEDELVQLNAKVAMLNLGTSVDTRPVKEKYRTVFREELNSDGEPVPYLGFRKYMLEVLDSTDPDPAAQELILEQQVEVARSARGAFRISSFESVSDAVFMPFLREPGPVLHSHVGVNMSPVARCNSLSPVEEGNLQDDMDDLSSVPCVAQRIPGAHPASEELDEQMKGKGLWSECTTEGAYL